ncbi:Organic anion transporter polypeptide OATP [Trinorchestia longiramus]|nr:Organic anion transporter polypeptide OATP [Trinorchestia longiramus]
MAADGQHPTTSDVTEHSGSLQSPINQGEDGSQRDAGSFSVHEATETLAKNPLKLRKSSSTEKKPSETSPKKKAAITENSGVVIGNFHAFETDEQTEVLVPRLVNGCSRVLPPPEPQQAQFNGSHNGTHTDGVVFRRRLYDSSNDTKCGIAGTCGCCQRLASRQTFMVIFCITTVLQGMFYTYFASGLSTIQKLYRISSQVTGIVMSATEVGQIGGSLFLAYYGGNGHRPRWISSGMLLFSFCTFLCAVPHFIYSFTEPRHFPHSLTTDQEVMDNFNTCSDLYADLSTSELNSTTEYGPEMMENCEDPSRLTNFVLFLFFLALIGVGIGQTAVVNLGIPYIDDNVDNKDSPMYFATTSAVRILGPTFGFMLGSVCTRLYVFPLEQPGFTTSDPRWVGAWWLGHILVSGLLLAASFVMFLFPRRLPEQPGPNQEASPDSPSFITSTTVTSVSSMTVGSPAEAKVRTNISALYHVDSTSVSRHSSAVNLPSNVGPPMGQVPNDGDTAGPHDPMLKPSTGGPDRREDPTLQERVEMQLLQQEAAAEVQYWSTYREKPTLKDFPRTVRRQLKNPVLVLRTASSVLHILPIAGLYTFLPKYLETQFRLPVHSAAFLAGIGGILLMGVGILISGFYIRYRRPSARAITAWIAVTALLYSMGMVLLMFVGCEQDDLVGMVFKDNSSTPVFEPLCNRSCSGSCDDSLYAPVCTQDGNTHFSACHLGCASVRKATNTSAMLFTDCECLDSKNTTAELRLCDLACDSIYWYIGIFAIFVIIHSTAEVGGMLITLRCCQKQDKAMALGLISLAIGLFGNMPCPIIYGGIVDAACIQWRSTCGTVGDCQLYDTLFFRYVFHGITAAVMLLAFFVDVAVWMKSKHIVLQPDAVEDDQIFWDGDPVETVTSHTAQPGPLHSSSPPTPSASPQLPPPKPSSTPVPNPPATSTASIPSPIIPEASSPVGLPSGVSSPCSSPSQLPSDSKSPSSPPAVKKSTLSSPRPKPSPRGPSSRPGTRPSSLSGSRQSSACRSSPGRSPPGTKPTLIKATPSSRLTGAESTRPNGGEKQKSGRQPVAKVKPRTDPRKMARPKSLQDRKSVTCSKPEDDPSTNKSYRSTAL